MKILERYIAKDFLSTFLGTLFVLTFVISLSFIFKIVDLISLGVPWRPIATILAASVPTSLTISIPMSALFSCLLIFGRLSADGEIIAIRACGLSLWQVTRTTLLMSAALTIVCLYINHYLAPRGHLLHYTTKIRMAGISPLNVLEEGRFQTFEGVTIYVGSKKGRLLEDVRIYDLRKPGLTREIRARSGELSMSESGSDLIADLQNVRIEPFSEDNPMPAFMGKLRWIIENVRKQRVYNMDEDDMIPGELLDRLRHIKEYFPNIGDEDLAVQRTAYRFAFSRRTVYSLSCMAFVLLGIPLGIRSHRRESSIGVALSLLLVFLFYLLVTLTESLKSRPAYHPEWLVWSPILLFTAIGLFLFWRMK